MSNEQLTPEQRVELLYHESDRLLHAIQTGVKARIEYGLSNDSDPKHLRVGINNALIAQGALTDLLVKKGLITEEEFAQTYVEFLKKEVESYELLLSAHLKTKVKLA